MRRPKTAVQEQLANQPTNLEMLFENTWHAMGGLPLTREFRFDPTRLWRFDYCLPDRRVAIECEGGAYSQGRHTQGPGFAKDCEKYNQAAARGWTVFRLTVDMIRDNPNKHLGLILDFVGRRSDAGID